MTYKGKTARQWHARYVKEHKALTRHGRMVRHLRRQLRERLAVFGASPIERNLLCIHSGEGSWTDPNAPYYGGLQMDRSFYTTYGPEFARAWGSPDHWPISAQLAVGMRAILSGRGYYPWPNTARACGLIG